jgi:opacity protein-like surface antigen
MRFSCGAEWPILRERADSLEGNPLRTIRVFLLAALSSALIATGAIAADPVMPAPTIVAPPPPSAPAFSWNRAYLGVYAGSWINCCGWMAGAYAGKNFNRGGNFLFGIEAMAGAYGGGAVSLEAYLLARAGFVLGTRFLLYGSFGAGWGGAIVPAAAAGVELALRNAASLRVQVLFYDVFNAPDYAIHGGLAWHFGGR